MSDISDDEQGLSPGGGTRLGGKKRANHNELERKRRQHQKERLNDLKEAVPALRSEKPSTVLILTKAKEYIDALTAKTQEYEAELAALREKAGLPPRPPKPLTAAAPAADSRSLELESLRNDNLELSAKVDALERRLQNKTIPASNNALTPPHVSVTPAKEKANYSPSLAAVAAVAAAAVAAENGMDPAKINFRKRKSYADNDFEAAKQDYYGRRNSTLEIMQDQAQRVINVNDLDLLQNFAVQARRASIPSAFMDAPPPPMLISEDPEKDHGDL